MGGKQHICAVDLGLCCGPGGLWRRLSEGVDNYAREDPAGKLGALFLALEILAVALDSGLGKGDVESEIHVWAWDVTGLPKGELGAVVKSWPEDWDFFCIQETYCNAWRRYEERAKLEQAAAARRRIFFSKDHRVATVVGAR